MRRIVVPATALLLAASATYAAAQTTRLDAAYSVYLTGIPVGRASVNIELSEAGFVASGSAKTTGFIRLISKGNGSANVHGTFQANRVISSTFSGRLNTSRREQKIDLSVVNGFAKEYSIDPPQQDPDKKRVPITNETRTNVVDPMSAMLALVSKGDILSAESCNRTLPIFDGRYRFNIVLSFRRTETITTDGYQGPVLVCQARYVPVAGHHADGAAIRQMAENRDMFVWLAPVSGARILAPIKASISSPIGNFIVEATRFRATQSR
ncbi:MAG: DUF3108 domain-containing protein [Xanthobacteraceae bacterium]|jgi:hypothetical protein|nr:DUF3108 domain-containing protein [Xanthobacteraceae bacterium]